MFSIACDTKETASSSVKTSHTPSHARIRKEHSGHRLNAEDERGRSRGRERKREKTEWVNHIAG